MSFATPASSADPPGVSLPPSSAKGGAPAQTATARLLFSAGTEAYYRKDWSQCRTKLLAAWDILKHWQIAVNLGECELELGFHRDAAEHLAYALRTMPAKAGAEKRVAVESLLDKLAAHIVTLTLTIDPPDAEVFVGGKSLGRGPFEAPVYLDANTRHTLVIRAEGRKEHRESIDGRPGLRWDVVQRLDPAAAPPPPPPLPKPVPVPGMPAPSKLPAIVMGALAVLGLTSGTTLLVAGSSKRSEAEQLAAGIKKGGCAADATPVDAQCAQVEHVARVSDARHNGGVAFLVGGGLAAVGAVSYLLLSPGLFEQRSRSPQQNGPRVRVAPVASGHSGGVLVKGVF
ncbi:hypothetical protein [Sorangium cellulosum]|nr:hypothetical protein [Sorangium cellulosum]